MLDRAALNQALAKIIAYKACGKDAEADRWGAILVQLLRDADVQF